jgi:hypothetical protein
VDAQAPCGKCNICGGTNFSRGPAQRLSITGRLPHCATCSSLERHRIARRVFDRLRPEYTTGKRFLQFGSDHAPDKRWFAELSVSAVGQAGGFDMQAIDLPDGHCDWIYSSHVLNRSPDPAAALREMHRVVGKSGVVMLSVGGTVFSYETALSMRGVDADCQLRTYGTEFADDLQAAVPDVAVLELVTADPCTASIDSVYLYSLDEDLLRQMARRVAPNNIHARVFPARQLARRSELARPSESAAASPVLPAKSAQAPKLLGLLETAAPAPCNVCGGNQFTGGPNNRRSSNGRDPRCASCGALERNRVMRRVFDALSAERTRCGRLLQFAAEPGLPEDWFEEVMVLTPNGKNELDGLAEGRFDWLCAYHLVSDGPNESRSVLDMLRVAGAHGVVALSLRGSASKYEQVSAPASESDVPHTSTGFVEDIQRKRPQVAVLELVTADPCTETIDAVYFCSSAWGSLERMSRLVAGSGVYARFFPAPQPTASAAEPVLRRTPAPRLHTPANALAAGNGWEMLHAEIEAWKASGQSARFWVRDDDAVTYTPELLELIELCGAENVPIALAVIPERARQDLKDAIVHRGVTVLQHGFDHKNRSHTGEKSEFPETRPLDEALGSVRDGWARLVDRFGNQAIPVFVPPWGTCSLAIRRGLPGARLSGYSGSPVGPFRPDELCRRGRAKTSVGLSLVSTHLAVNRAQAGDVSPLPIGRYLTHLTNLVSAIRTDDADPDEPIGVMTHAWGVDAEVRDFLRELFRVTRDAGAEWADARNLFVP